MVWEGGVSSNSASPIFISPLKLALLNHSEVEYAPWSHGPADWDKTDFLPVNWHVLITSS